MKHGGDPAHRPEGRAAGSFGFRRVALDWLASNVALFALTCVLVLILYGQALNDFFQSDDFIFLRAARFADLNAYVKESFDFTHYDKHDEFIEFLKDYDVAVPFLSYRPLYFISLKLMNIAFDTNPVGYHVVSLTVHLVNTYLVWRLATRFIDGRIGTHVAALIFALHPAYVPTVAWISDIGTPLAACSVLLAFLSCARATETSGRRWVWFSGSVAAYGLSILFHQETISWVAVLIGYAVLSAHLTGERLPYRSTWGYAGPIAAIALGAYLLNSWITANTPVHEESFGFGANNFTHFKNFASGAVYPVVSENGAANFAAFLGFLGVLVSAPLLARIRRERSTLPLKELLVVGWVLAALSPLLTVDGFFGVGILFRKLYAVGPGVAILLALFVTQLVRLAVPRAVRASTAALVVLAAIAVCGELFIGFDRRNDVTEIAVAWDGYADRLRAAYPDLEEGSTLYVVGAPPLIRSFRDIYVVSSAQAYYGKVLAEAINEEQAAELEPSLGDNEHIFRYSDADASE